MPQAESHCLENFVTHQVKKFRLSCDCTYVHIALHVNQQALMTGPEGK